MRWPSRIPLRYVRNGILSVAFALLFFGFGYQYALLRQKGSDNALVQRFLGNPRDSEVVGADFSKFWEAWRRLEQSYVDPSALDYREMTYGSIEGLAQSLGDPYTQYLRPEDNELSMQDLDGAFYGVGIELGYRNGSLAVVAPLEGGPAKRAGVRAGDYIVHLRDDRKGIDEDTSGISLLEAVRKIRGERGEPITLTLVREGTDEPFEVEIVREEIVVPSVDLSYISRNGKTFAHLELHRYGGRTDEEWTTRVSEIASRGVDGVILDLRDNPGGYLDGSVFIASEFLREGTVVQQQGRYETETFDVDRVGQLLDVPLVVLVNKGSASASEITAGALQDYGRAILVGEQTFGKGTVQEVQELSDGSSLHITIAKWLLPDGYWIGEGGVTPDVPVVDDPVTEDVDEQLERAVEVLL